MNRATATVKQALVWVGEAGSKVNRDERLSLLNEVRQWAYSYRQDLGLDLSFTFTVGLYTETDERGRVYKSFTVPADFQSLEAVTIGGMPVHVRSQYRTPYDGTSGSPCSVQLFDRGWKGLERPLTKDSPIAFVCQGGTAKSQTMLVSGQTIEGEMVQAEYQVTRDLQKSKEVWQSINQVQFPDKCVGTVVIKQDFRELARFHHDDEIPMFREYEARACSSDVITIRANRIFRDLTDDLELVEFGNSLVWKHLTRYLNLFHKKDKDAQDLQNMSLWRDEAVSLLRADVSNEEGEAVLHTFQRVAITSGQLSS